MSGVTAGLSPRDLVAHSETVLLTATSRLGGDRALRSRVLGGPLLRLCSPSLLGDPFGPLTLPSDPHPQSLPWALLLAGGTQDPALQRSVRFAGGFCALQMDE